MMNLERLFDGFFDDRKISLTELSNYGAMGITRMITLNPGAVFGPRITATQVALAALESKTTDSGVKLAIQKGRTFDKKAFRAALPGQMTKIHAKVVAQYGKPSAELLEIFPKGLSAFDCRDEQLENEMQVTHAGLVAHQADLGATVVNELGALLSEWISTFAAQGGAKTMAKTASNQELKDLRKALELELHKNALFVALTFPLDKAKGMYYLPQELLRNPKPSIGVPGAASIHQVDVDDATREVTLRMQSLGAQTMKLTRKGQFELEATVIAASIAVVNGVCVFTDTAPTDGLWFYQAVPSNEGGEGTASAELGVQVG